jgi:hypothetical protein
VFAICGSPYRTCEGLSRREWLRVGGLGALSLPQLLSSRSVAGGRLPATSRRGFGKARSCIVLFMFGAPAHQDTWDLKPRAPAEIRGEFQPIATSVPGLQVCEHMPLLAARAHHLAVIRSVTHPDNTHTVAMHYMLTGVRHARPATNPQNAPDDFPCFGAVINYAQARWGWKPAAGSSAMGGGVALAPPGLPAAISLNAPANQVSANNHIFPGFFAGFLGNRYDPLFVPQNANASNLEPIPPAAAGPRLPARRELLAAIDVQARRWERWADVAGVGTHQAQAFELLTSPAARRAFDLALERPALRERYGNTPFGQGCLLARRLVEAGVPLVTVNWERDDAYWDTHKNNFVDHRDKLIPNLDRGFSALLDDLHERGLLAETLIVWLGEFGRTPTINAQAGRDHWAPCQSVVLAGGGLPGGQVYGASDRLAAYPQRDPVSPEDLAATIYHLLGVDYEAEIPGPLGRPLPLSSGNVLWKLVA